MNMFENMAAIKTSNGVVSYWKAFYNVTIFHIFVEYSFISHKLLYQQNLL